MYSGSDFKHIPQDYYACVDLIDSCFRMNIVAFAKELMEERDSISCYADLKQLVVDLLSKLNTWSKYEKGSLRDCPDLAQPRVVMLEEVDPTGALVLAPPLTLHLFSRALAATVPVSLYMAGCQAQMGTH